jgi:GntR family transcriptional regulator, rspAB operon transcriptional repressor
MSAGKGRSCKATTPPLSDARKRRSIWGVAPISKAEQVYGAVKEAILSGTLEPGAPIDKLALCDRLGVSRFPVSAAISRLAFEQLVLVEPQHGSFVARISADDARERLFIRRALEGEIAAEAARRLDQAGRSALEENLREAAKAAEAGDRTKFYALDVGFHAALASHLGLDRSGEILDGLRAHLERVRRLLMLPPGRMQATLVEHQAVVEAILSSDARRARAAMEAHITAMTTMVENFARERPELFYA